MYLGILIDCHRNWKEHIQQLPKKYRGIGVICNSSCDCNLQNSAKCDSKTGLCLCVPGFKGIRCDEVSIVLLGAIVGQIEP